MIVIRNFFLGIRFFFIKVIASMLLAYIIPIINLLIVYVLLENNNVEIIWKMSAINILLATNACYIASISGYFKVNEKYNSIVGYIKTIGLILSTVVFSLSTYELTKMEFNINISIYYFTVAITTIICIVLTCFVKVEDRDINKKLEKSDIEKAKDIIRKSNGKNKFEMDGMNFDA